MRIVKLLDFDVNTIYIDLDNISTIIISNKKTSNKFVIVYDVNNKISVISDKKVNKKLLEWIYKNEKIFTYYVPNIIDGNLRKKAINWAYIAQNDTEQFIEFSKLSDNFKYFLTVFNYHVEQNLKGLK